MKWVNPSFFLLVSRADSKLVVSLKEDRRWDVYGSFSLEQLKEDIILSMGFSLRWDIITLIPNAFEKPRLCKWVSWTDTKEIISPKEEEKWLGGLIA